MAMFPYNEFSSLTVRNVSFDSGNPTVVYDGMGLPLCGHATITSILIANKSDDPKMISFSVRKMDDTSDTQIFHQVQVPVNKPYDILQGSKIFLKKEDVLKAWTDVNGEGWFDLFVSYVIYTPSDLQPVI